jgi:hypothetical protein
MELNQYSALYIGRFQTVFLVIAELILLSVNNFASNKVIITSLGKVNYMKAHSNRNRKAIQFINRFYAGEYI